MAGKFYEVVLPLERNIVKPAVQNLRQILLASKMEGSLQELDETAYWQELLVESEIFPAERLADLQKETDELIAIFVASIKTAKKNK